jgi:hypothetical protein
MTTIVDSVTTNQTEENMSTTWVTETVKPVKVPAPAWRKGARALAKRFGTGDIMCAEDPDQTGRWAITQSYALRFFEPDSIEAQAVSLWRDYDCVTVGIDDDGARVAVKVHKGGKNDMTLPDARLHAPSWERMNGLFPDMDGNHVVATELVPVEGRDGEVDAMDADGNRLARFTTTILQGVLGSGETLLVNPQAPHKPAVIGHTGGAGLVVVGLVMPVRVP